LSDLNAMSPERKKRNPGIDALRGLSIVLVVLFHIKIRFPILESDLADILPHRLLELLTNNGFEGVFIFFAISGFLITKHTLRRAGALAQIDLRSFYIRRAARILPFLFLLVGVLSIMHLLEVPEFTIDEDRQSLSGAIFSALFLHLNWYEAQTGYLPGAWDVMWSLSIEEVFYIGFPLVCVLLRRDGLLAIAFLVLAISLPYTRADISDWMWMSKAYLPGMASIAMGILAAMLAHRLPQPRQWVCLTLQGVGCLGIVGALGFSDVLWPRMGHWMMLGLTFSTAVLLLGMDCRVRGYEVRPLPGLGWLRSFGRLSYEIYLTHMFVVLAFNGIAVAIGQNLDLGYLWYLPILLASWVPGYLVSRYYTDPCDEALRQRWLPKVAATS